MATIPFVIMASGIVENWIFFGICYSILSGLITIASVSITTIQQQESTEYNIGKISSIETRIRQKSLEKSTTTWQYLFEMLFDMGPFLLNRIVLR